MKSIYLALGLAVLLPASFAVPARAETFQVTINKLVFTPAEIKAHVGDVIEWINSDLFDHTATAKNNEWDIKIPKGAKKSVTLTKPGEIDYYCRLHPNMTGKLIVAPK